MRSVLQGAADIPGLLIVAGVVVHGAGDRAEVAQADFPVEAVVLPVEGEHPAVGKKLKRLKHYSELRI